MRHVLQNSARLTLLALVAGTLAGCGTQNLVGPASMRETSTMETAQASALIADAQAPADPGTYTLTPGPSGDDVQVDPPVAGLKTKKPKKPHPRGRH